MTAKNTRTRLGFTLIQLIVLVVIVGLLITSLVIIYNSFHTSSSAAANGGIIPITTSSKEQTKQKADQIQRRCSIMSPQQKEQLQQSNQPAQCNS